MKDFNIRTARAATARPADAGRAHAEGDQCRCACGSLLARVVREGLELKCRKCKTLVLITHEELVEMYRAQGFDAPGGKPHR